MFRRLTLSQKIIYYYNNGDILSKKRFSRIVANSKMAFPSKFVFELVASDNTEIRINGLLALRKLDFAECKELLLSALQIPKYQDMEDRLGDFAKIQRAVIDVLAHFGQLELLLDKKAKFNYYFYYAMEILFSFIATQKLFALIPIVDRIMTEAKEPNIKIHGLRTYAELGLDVKVSVAAEDLMSKHPDIMATHSFLQIVHYLTEDTAISIVRAILDKTKNNDRNHLRYNYLADALEHIGTPEAIKILQELAWNAASTSDVDTRSLETELYLRAMQPFASVNQEQWLINLITTFGLDRHALRRAIETLGISGTQASIPLLENHLRSDDPNERIVAFWAIAEINRRLGEEWYNGEERIVSQ